MLKGSAEMERASNTVAAQRQDLCGKTLGDYTIVRWIGGGATSDVFLAKQNSLKRNVALKILKDDLADDATYVKRFIHEARSAARLEHPNVVRVYEVGELVDNCAPKRFWISEKKRRAQAKVYRFIAQEYVAGLSLAQYLHRNGPLSIEQTFAALEQIAAALKRAADFNLVHRDVKPENIILDPSGVIHVVDFGLARPVESNDETWTEASLTRTGVALGTPLYMSPEQARGQKLDSRSDVYSLGVTAYHMLVGEVPFRGDTPLSVVLKHLNEKPRPIRELRPETPKALADLIERMLAKKPDDRPASPAVLLAELKDAKRDYWRTRETQTSDVSYVEKSEASALPLERDTSSASEEKTNNPSSETSLLSGGSDEVDTSDVPSFFQSQDERRVFEHAINTTAMTLEWRTNIDRLDAELRANDKYWTPRRIALMAISLVVAFLVGGGVLTLRNMRLAAAIPEPPLSIQRFDTVEEQYVFALQTGTVDAWKSVVEYFPDEEYWTSRAKRQLALVYVAEDDVDAADSLFKELAASSSSVDYDPFPIAGIAWVAAARGDVDKATARISELSYYRSNDRMTEVLVSKTRELIQGRNAGLQFFRGRDGNVRTPPETRQNDRSPGNAPRGNAGPQPRRGFPD